MNLYVKTALDIFHQPRVVFCDGRLAWLKLDVEETQEIRFCSVFFANFENMFGNFATLFAVLAPNVTTALTPAQLLCGQLNEFNTITRDNCHQHE